jgi:hypothetical protein
MVRTHPLIVAVWCLASGCLVPTDEFAPDAAVLGLGDAGIEETVDGGVPFLDCTDSPRYFPSYQFLHRIPQGCTFFEGRLRGVGFQTVNPSTEPPTPGGDDVLYDSPTSIISSLREVDGGIDISNLIVSRNIQGLKSLETVSGTFALAGHELGSVSGAARLRVVGGLYLENCNKMRDVELSSLEVVAGDMWLRENPELQTLAGLKKLRGIGGHLFLERNPKLTQAAVTEFLSRVSVDGGVRRR